ncbi:hypothetical protein [Rhodovulum sulfidophilum]|uniref:hypothetical protein n=1 Tax=Rhodovulum sulfidophilum TaxID=35806 RepID=UPI001914D302|nr:hypothetical protein [Rhodovulum sulfidophilum]
MGRQGREPNKLTPQERAAFEKELEDFQPEMPMDSDDATGAPTGRNNKGVLSRRYKREVAFRAWEYLERHDPAQPLPTWVSAYLRDVAGKILADLGPLGSLPPASAHAALGLVGEQWSKHHPESVYAIISAWIDPDQPGGPVVSGRKAGAVRYIEEYMGNDPNIQVKTVIEWYRKGQKSHVGAR